MSGEIFRDRTDGGRRLGEALSTYAHRPEVIVLGLPRGGIPVAAEVAHVLAVPFDLWLVRKLGVPGHDELAMGALAEGGIEVLDDHLIRELGVSHGEVAAVARREHVELARRAELYRAGRPRPALAGRVVILVDDGLATGRTMEAAIAAARALGPARIVAAAPVAAAQTVHRLRQVADEVVAVVVPQNLQAVGLWYEDFTQTTDDEVGRLLRSVHE